MRWARTTAMAIGGVALVVAASACGSRSGLRSDRVEAKGADATAGASPIGGSGTAKAGAAGAGSGGSGTATGGSAGTGALCVDFAPETQQAAALDVFFLLDTSGSMNESTSAGVKKLAAVKSALAAFLATPKGKGARAALFRFPLPEELPKCEKKSDCGEGTACETGGTCENDPKISCFTTLQCGGAPCVNKAYCQFSSDPCSTNDDCPPGTGECWFGGFCTTKSTCDPKAYESPIVALTPFSSPALADGIASLEAKGPTPTLPAYEGAAGVARGSAKATKAPTIVVVVSDGLPSVCGSPTPLDDAVVSAKLAKVANAALGDGVTTHALGVFAKKEQDFALPSLDGFAKAGGGGAFLITPDGNLSASFLAAMDAILKSALSCTYHLPDLGGMTLDPSTVKVTVGGASLVHVPGPSACTDDGFYLSSDLSPDAPPELVLLCPDACTTQPVALGVSVQGSCTDPG